MSSLQMQPAPSNTNSTRVEVIDRNSEDDETFVRVRDLLDFSNAPGEWNTGELPTIREQTSALRKLLDPQEIERPLSHSLLAYQGSKATLRMLNAAAGGYDDPMTLTRTALSQLAQRVLPGRGLAFVDGLRRIGASGQQLSEINWNLFLQQQSRHPALLRTVKLPGQPVRSVRAVLSQKYAIVDNLDVLDALLDNEEAARLPVISVKITEDAMRVRLALDPNLMNASDALNFDALTKRPIPMIEVWNSEVGKASVNVQVGTYRVLCANGMTGWGGDSSHWRWNHSGNGNANERISNGISDALKSARVIAEGMVEAQVASTSVAIDDAFALMTQWANGTLTKTQIATAQQCMSDETSGPKNSLASIVEGLTLAAQSEGDLFEQRSVEQFASRVLQRGLIIARNSDNAIRNVRDTSVGEA